MPTVAAWHDGAEADTAKAGECGRATCETPCGCAGGICAGIRREGASHGEELWGQGCTQRPSGEGQRSNAEAR